MPVAMMMLMPYWPKNTDFDASADGVSVLVMVAPMTTSTVAASVML